MPIRLLDPHREYAQIRADLEKEWCDVFQHMRLLGGEQVRLFERDIAAYIGVPHACGVASGTDALVVGMASLSIGSGDRVIIPTNAFVAALEAVHHLGATPVLVDVAQDSFAPDLTQIESCLPASAILIVHLYGAAFDVESVLALCRDSTTKLIEDGSHGHGASRHGKKVGAFGAIGCFSAGVVKNLGAYGDAGFITTRDSQIDKRIRELQRHGQRQKNEHLSYGYNSRLDELQAAVLRIKLRRLDQQNRRRRAIAAFYSDRLSASAIRVPQENPAEVAVYHQYVIRTPDRDRLRKHLLTRDIETGIHYPVPLHRQPAWLAAYGEHPSLPRAERLASEILSLPVYPDLSDAEVEHVAEAVASFSRR